MKKKIWLISFMILFGWTLSVSADLIELKGGRYVGGQIIEQTDEYVKILVDGASVTYPSEDIVKIDKTKEATLQGAARSIKTGYLNFRNQRVQLDIYNPGTKNRPVLIILHGIEGIEGEQGVRYFQLASDLMSRGFIVINVHYGQSQPTLWTETVIKTIGFAQVIPNADKGRIGLVGYSVGGALALEAASLDERVKLLVIHSGYMPQGFSQEQADRLPHTLMICGDQDPVIQSLAQLQKWLVDLKKPLEAYINKGYSYNNMPSKVWSENQATIATFFIQNF
ncbi:MAG: dienelactone hydrolase family protein [Candidatus Omnitrophota bacterium]